MKFHFLLPSIKGIPVLMYHRVMPDEQDGLTVSTIQLREQWSYLKEQGYTSLSLEEFYERAIGNIKSNGKEVLLTFDDGYYNNMVHMKPLLEEFDFHATIFLIADAIAAHEKPTYEGLMTTDDLKQFDSNKVSFGLHGFHHENFKETSLVNLKEAITKSIAVFKENNIKYYPAIAYPFGARPEGILKQWMKSQGIKMAFRIGNQPAKVPAKDLFEIKRIDIRGTDSLNDFIIKLKKGKLKPF